MQYLLSFAYMSGYRSWFYILMLILGLNWQGVEWVYNHILFKHEKQATYWKKMCFISQIKMKHRKYLTLWIYNNLDFSV